jgi:hypothetical protein
MAEQQPISPRRRLQELLAIPERQRTDAQWDEINELEITLASVNRATAAGQEVRRSPVAPPARPKPSGGDGKSPSKKFRRKR